jgi:hypothetical protein
VFSGIDELFNHDIATAKPTTTGVAFSGTLH